MGGNLIHYWRPKRKRTVEESYAISITDLRKNGCFGSGAWMPKTYTWQNTQTKRTSFEVFIAINMNESEPRMQLEHSSPRSGEKLCYSVRLTTTTPNYGGLRWWFLCPIRDCGRRVAKLYVSAEWHHFGCRQCRHLTYRSSQESRKYDGVDAMLARELGIDIKTIRQLYRT